MNRMSRILACIVMAVNVTGCSFMNSREEKITDYSAEVTQAISSVLADVSQAPEVCQSSLYQTKVASESDTAKQTAQQYLACCKVSSVTGKDTEYEVILSVPDLDAVRKSMWEDSGFTQDYEKLVAQATEETAVKDYIFSYVFNCLQSGLATEREYQFSIGFDGEQLEDDNFVCLLTGSLLSHDFVTGGTSEEGETGSTEEGGSEVGENGVEPVYQEISTEQCIIDAVDSSPICVFGIQILHGAEAAQEVKALSPANGSLALPDGGTIYYVKYRVRNLSQNAVTVKNGFRLVSPDFKVLENTGNSIIGLADVVNVEAGAEAELSCCLFGDSSSRLFWCEEGYCNTTLVVE